jgi:DNA invertase Pin-like site-specific DNA recombinase
MSLARKPVDIYIRVSRIGGREHLISPQDQEQRARQLARERGLDVGVVLPPDLDESGSHLRRPGLQEGLRRVESGVSGGIIVAWLDRLSRDSEHAHTLVRRIMEAGGAIYAPDAPTDWTSPEGELQAGIVFAFAQYVRKRARAGFEQAKQQAIARGIPINSRPAVGYIKGPDRRLVLDSKVAPLVREVFIRRGRGEGPTGLAKFLEENGVKTSQGSATWSTVAVYGLLRNRVYLGEVAYGRDRRFVNAVAHEPIVDIATWQMAQGDAPRRPPSTGRTYLLSGLLRCRSCRHAMTGTTDSHGTRIYRCRRRHAGGICAKPARVRGETIESLVLADFWTQCESQGCTEDHDRIRDVAELTRAVARERSTLSEWASPAMQAAIGDVELYITGIRQRRMRVAEAEAALEIERARSSHLIADRSSLRWVWNEMPISERFALLAAAYDCIALSRKPDLVVAYPIGTGPANLPRQGYRCSPDLRPFSDDLPSNARILAVAL